MPHRPTPERLSAFSDGVFAVLITVLVLDLRPPEQPTFRALMLLWPTWLSYAAALYRLDGRERISAAAGCFLCGGFLSGERDVRIFDLGAY